MDYTVYIGHDGQRSDQSESSIKYTANVLRDYKCFRDSKFTRMGQYFITHIYIATVYVHE